MTSKSVRATVQKVSRQSIDLSSQGSMEPPGVRQRKEARWGIKSAPSAARGRPRREHQFMQQQQVLQQQRRQRRLRQWRWGSLVPVALTPW